MEKSDMATIRSKIIVNVIIVLLTVIVIVGMEYRSISHLGRLQDEGGKRSDETVLAANASRVGLSLYSVIADAIINRDLDATAKDWADIKDRNLKRLDEVAKLANTAEEKQLAEDAKKSANEIVTIFETKTLPLLKSTTEITKEIRDLDALTDKSVKALRSDMLKIEELLEKDSKKADEEFDSTRKAALIEALIIGLIGILLQAGLATWMLRAIMKPVDALRLMLMDISQGEGDLTKRLDDTTRDELAEISKYFNLFIEKLRTIISNISQTSNQVATAANQLQSTAERIATGSEEVAAQASTVATAG